jgi:hypothetical protein
LIVARQSITINFDPALTSMGEVQSIAERHCDEFGEDALPSTSVDSPWGLRNTSFVCKPRG